MSHALNETTGETGAPKAVGLLGGSFNPAHGGHLEISLAALDVLPLSEVWWLVSPGNPLKDPDVYAPYETRLAQAQEVAADSRIKISDFEARADVQYTIDTLTALRSAHPDTRFIWLMGADSLETFHRWKDWRAIVNTVAIAVFNRPGHEKAVETAAVAQELSPYKVEISEADTIVSRKLPAWTFIPSTENPTSSTDLRKTGKERHGRNKHREQRRGDA